MKVDKMDESEWKYPSCYMHAWFSDAVVDDIDIDDDDEVYCELPQELSGKLPLW